MFSLNKHDIVRSTNLKARHRCVCFGFGHRWFAGRYLPFSGSLSTLNGSSWKSRLVLTSLFTTEEIVKRKLSRSLWLFCHVSQILIINDIENVWEVFVFWALEFAIVWLAVFKFSFYFRVFTQADNKTRLWSYELTLSDYRLQIKAMNLKSFSWTSKKRELYLWWLMMVSQV